MGFPLYVAGQRWYGYRETSTPLAGVIVGNFLRQQNSLTIYMNSNARTLFCPVIMLLGLITDDIGYCPNLLLNIRSCPEMTNMALKLTQRLL